MNNFETHSSRFEETTRYFLGLDLGQSNDSTAISVVRRNRVIEWYGHHAKPLTRIKSETFQVGYLERTPLGTTYPAIVNHVARLLQRSTWAGNIDLTIDRTGVGAPVCDLFKAAGLTHIGVTITGGDSESSDGTFVYRVPKLTLISQLQALLHEGKLQIHRALPEAATLVRELQDFRVAYTDAGRMTFGAREGAHDDLVLSLAIAVWRATRPENKLTVKSLPPI